MWFFEMKYITRMLNHKTLNQFPLIRKGSNHSIVLGIETSCDDTGVAILNTNGQILGDSLFSQNVTHLRYGGVNPLIARDLHSDNIELAVNETLQKAQLQIKDIDAIAVTSKPGLLFSLQIGVKYAIYLSKNYKKPIIPIHHMEAHALVPRMCHEIEFPFLTLLISGGHCLLALVTDIDNFYLLGETLDNAPGEILDKVARRMKLRNMPEYSQVCGGKAVELAAEKSNNEDSFDFPLPLHKVRDCNFSFSGLKDALIRQLLKKELEHNIQADEIIPEVNDLCASFQAAVARHILQRTERAMLFCEKYNHVPKSNKKLVVSGGVACNNYIFNYLKLLGEQKGFNVLRPPHKLCTDNGIMIAWNGIEKIKKGYSYPNFSVSDIEPIARLGENIVDKVKESSIYVKFTRLKELNK